MTQNTHTHLGSDVSHRLPSKTGYLLSLIVGMLALSGPFLNEVRADDLEQTEFFESRIRPVLVTHCYECHNSADGGQGGLALDDRRGFLQGGDNGAVIVPGDPDSSRLLPILRHEVEGLEMPQGGEKLGDTVIADFETWIRNGAHDPRDAPPTQDELDQATSWDAVQAKRLTWWSFQPITSPPVPEVSGQDAPTHPIDRFILHTLQSQQLPPAKLAADPVLIRRLYFVLIGLPPTIEQLQHWEGRLAGLEGAARQQVVEELVDELLASPQFGERWARHWMDWIRYAESHGSEGDPEIVNAWMYRDYLIRALNADVPYDQLIREHLAGDLLDAPRINEELQINESAIGPAHFRMVFHGFGPTDALEEKVRFTDDQINVFSKAFQSLTVSCARCHNHKFDPISQADYYALFGIFASTRPARKVIDLPRHDASEREHLAELKPMIRDALAHDWLTSLDDFRQKLESNGSGGMNDANRMDVLSIWNRCRQATPDSEGFHLVWSDIAREWQATAGDANSELPQALKHWRLDDPDDFAEWFPAEAGLAQAPTPAGEFAIQPEGNVVRGIYPAGVYSHLLSTKMAARLTSPNIPLTADSDLWVRVQGTDGAQLRYVPQNYPRTGLIYPTRDLTPGWHWEEFDMSYWTGDSVHIELATARDVPLPDRLDERSWFGVQEAYVLPHGHPAPPSDVQSLRPLMELAQSQRPKSLDDLAELYRATLAKAIAGWRDGTLTNEQARFLDACLSAKLLPNQPAELPAAASLVSEYRQLEASLDVPTRVPGIDEGPGRDQPLFTRGDHHHPADPVPRRFLSGFDSEPYQTESSGRQQLAEDLLSSTNSLTRRVIVNRLWHHLFGQGLVPSVDNFGRLGDEPSHPELLDWLATQFAKDDWSLKQSIRLMVTSETWQRSSVASEAARLEDPENHWLSHTNLRRLEAESIRDALLQVSGQLDATLFGPPVGEASPRRSLYLRVHRNALNPFLRTFDFPEPFSTTGRRSATNVPAQSLTLLNDPLIGRDAERWARRILDDSQVTTQRERVTAMFQQAFGRTPREEEFSEIDAFLSESSQVQQERQRSRAGLEDNLARKETELQSILQPAREEIAAARGMTAPDPATLPQPLGNWTFDEDFSDQQGTVHAQERNGAQVKEGALVVGGKQFAQTSPLPVTLTTKTLEVWVRLDTLDQSGGAALSVINPGTGQFDAIVFAEFEPKKWMAGSDNFRRTRSLHAADETTANDQPVQIVIAYDADGTVRAYRNGKPYGTAYSTDGPASFPAEETIVTFGLRHFPAGDNRVLSGQIDQACIYDTALSAEAIRDVYAEKQFSVTQEDLFASLSAEDRRQVQSLQAESDQIRARLAARDPSTRLSPELFAWSELARALYTFQEFIYLQ